MKLKIFAATILVGCGLSTAAMADASSELVTASGSSKYDFRIGLQALDDRGRDPGRVEYIKYLSAGSNVQSEWAVDRDAYDPDALKLHLSILNHIPSNRDFRIAIQAADRNGRGDFGYWQYTPWASEGGGWSGMAFDTDRHDPDAFRIRIETRTWQSSRSLSDFRIGLRVSDRGGRETGEATYTPWASYGGGWTGLATDNDAYDFDGFEVNLEVRQ
ncbi:hypothetical protein [Pseudoalteromonas luteoviolacea]|uniref:Uncharacterized protein n=1 Tax=Pseudoalteromonas luteoviolacea (strain 2ta16) TaxID=1353533 RepID=V4HKR3_PSEL2|nr:hypothetical protein [Pseudoalteromonas luteoviolacea]ESP91405.1 hypothetical protein PL2TA16_00204 [Pseudoalteromonas luteoviolacea 2ta16]KZN40051.1 hypothetical protein N483_17850 [Pseudoalteromonas luteoviolacea NCIMB 1944]